MIKRYLEVHKRKGIVKNPVFIEDIRPISTVYAVEIEFSDEGSIALPNVGGKGLKFNLNTPLTQQEIDAVGLVKTLSDGTFTYIESDLDSAKNAKKAEIRAAFLNEIQNGKISSTALGIDVDVRRGADVNDLQNVQALVDYMEAEEISTTYYKGYSETVEDVTVADLNGLVVEMDAYGVMLYQKKHTKESAIDDAATIQAVNAISWTS